MESVVLASAFPTCAIVITCALPDGVRMEGVILAWGLPKCAAVFTLTLPEGCGWRVSFWLGGVKSVRHFRVLSSTPPKYMHLHSCRVSAPFDVLLSLSLSPELCFQARVA